MGIDYDNEVKIMYLECDGPKCNESEDLDADEWQDGIDQMKELGWLIKLYEDVWYHLCPECKNKGVKVEDC